MKGDGAYLLISYCQLHVEWMDCTVEIGKEDALGLGFQRLREGHFEVDAIDECSQRWSLRTKCCEIEMVRHLITVLGFSSKTPTPTQILGRGGASVVLKARARAIT